MLLTCNYWPTGVVTVSLVILCQLVISVDHAIVMEMQILTIQIGAIIELGNVYSA